MAEISKAKPTILIIDDDEHIRGLLKELLRDEHECVFQAVETAQLIFRVHCKHVAEAKC